MNRGSGSTPADSDPWDSAFPRPSARSLPGRTSWFSQLSVTAAFRMSIPELATIVNQSLPIKIIVMNNGYLGMVRQWQELFYNNRLSQVELSSFPDAEKLAGAYGFKGRTVENAKELTAALEQAVSEPGPYLLNVRVSPFENVFPMVPAGGAINEMVLRQPQPVEV